MHLVLSPPFQNACFTSLAELSDSQKLGIYTKIKMNVNLLLDGAKTIKKGRFWEQQESFDKKCRLEVNYVLRQTLPLILRMHPERGAGEGRRQRLLVEEEEEVKKMSLLEDIEQELLKYRKEGDTEDRSGGLLWKARKERIKDPSNERKDMNTREFVHEDELLVFEIESVPEGLEDSVCYVLGLPPFQPLSLPPGSQPPCLPALPPSSLASTSTTALIWREAYRLHLALGDTVYTVRSAKIGFQIRDIFLC